jgi:hypothetical protein
VSALSEVQGLDGLDRTFMGGPVGARTRQAELCLHCGRLRSASGSHDRSDPYCSSWPLLAGAGVTVARPRCRVLARRGRAGFGPPHPLAGGGFWYSPVGPRAWPGR